MSVTIDYGRLWGLSTRIRITGTIRRLKGRLAVDGSVSFGFANPGDTPVSVRGQIPPEGGTYLYQLWFRHQAPQYCTPERFHVSNGLEITFGL